MSFDPVDVSARIARLERDNRRLRVAGALGLLALAALVLTAQDGTSRRVLAAHQFIVQDKDGKHRAWLGVNDKDETTLLFYGVDERTPRLLLASTIAGAARVNVHDKEGRPRGSMSIEADGSVCVGTFDEGATPRTWMRCTKSGDPKIGIGSAAAQPVVEMFAGKDAAAALALRDEACRDRLRLDLSKNGLPRVALFDPNLLVGQFFSDKDSIAALTLHDAAGKERVRAEVGEKGDPLLKIVDGKGRALFKEPSR